MRRRWLNRTLNAYPASNYTKIVLQLGRVRLSSLLGPTRLATVPLFMKDRIERTVSDLREILAARVSRDELFTSRDKWDDTASFTDSQSPTIIDGGAAIEAEDSVGAFREIFEAPIIEAFEPRPDAAAELARVHGSETVSIHQKALGAETRDIVLNVSGGASSVLDPEDMSDAPRPDLDIEGELEVEQVALDDYLDTTPDVIKLDLQGYELEALEGASEILEDVNVVLAEVNFRRIYRDATTFSAIAEYLGEQGFVLYHLYDVETWPTGELVWADALFLRHPPSDSGRP